MCIFQARSAKLSRGPINGCELIDSPGVIQRIDRDINTVNVFVFQQFPVCTERFVVCNSVVLSDNSCVVVLASGADSNFCYGIFGVSKISITSIIDLYPSIPTA